MNFGERLRFLREENSLTQSELAKKLNISRQSISNYENGARFPNDVELLIRISTLFCVSLDYLVGLSNIRIPFKINIRKSEFYIMEKKNSYLSSKHHILEELFSEMDNMSTEELVKLLKILKVMNDKL